MTGMGSDPLGTSPSEPGAAATIEGGPRDDTFLESWAHAEESEGLGVCFALHREPATPSTCYFWLRNGKHVERTTLVRIPAQLPGGLAVTFFGVVEEVCVASHEDLRAVVEDAQQSYRALEPLDVGTAGLTWARVQLLASEPAVFAPPPQGAEVFLATPADAQRAYGFDVMEHRAPLGVLRSGRSGVMGPAFLDLDFVLGANGAHVNITGMAGVAAKSSAMLTIMASLMQTAAQRRREQPGSPDNVVPVPVIFSVKGYDLLWLDEASRRFEVARDGALWEAMGFPASPMPFRAVRVLSPADPRNPSAARVVAGRTAEPYGWALEDIIAQNLFEFLFSDADNGRDTFQGLLAVLAEQLVDDSSGTRRLRRGAPRSFRELLTYLTDAADTDGHPLAAQTHPATIKAFRRRLTKILLQGDGVLVMGDRGCPPKLIGADTLDPDTGLPRPIVIDLHSLGMGEAGYAVQRFAVAAILRAMETDRLRADADPAIRFCIGLDELNRYAPLRGEDPITRYLEYVAAELRSMGVILIGAQQQASLISQRILQNCATRLIGRTEAAELLSPAFSHVPVGLRQVVARFRPGEMLLLQPTFEHPAAIRMPMPPWAMRRGDLMATPGAGAPAPRGSHPAGEGNAGMRLTSAEGAVRARVVFEE